MPETQVTEDLDFSKFFDAAVAGTGPEGEAAAPVVEAPVVEPPSVDPPAVDPPAVEAPVVPTVDTAKLIADTAAATAAAFKPTAPEAPAEPAAPVVDPEVEQKIVKFREDWPEHAAVMDIALKAQQEAMMAEFAKLLAPLQGQLAPMVEDAEARAQAAHEAAILQTHADAFTILPKVEEWVKAKPAYLQPALNAVLDSGTAADINALLTDYKKETTPAAAPRVDADRQKKIQTTAPVAGLRQDGTSGVLDPADFEGAFRAAAAEAAAQA